MTLPPDAPSFGGVAAPDEEQPTFTPEEPTRRPSAPVRVWDPQAQMGQRWQTPAPARPTPAYEAAATTQLGPLPKEEDIERVMLWAETADHFRWQYGTPETRQMAIRFLRLSDSNPDLLLFGDQHFAAAAYASEAAWFGLSMGDGEVTPLRQQQVGAAAIEAAAGLIDGLDTYFLTPQRVAEQNQKWIDLNLELSQTRVPWTPRQYSNLTPEQVELLDPEVRESQRTEAETTVWTITSNWNVRPLRAMVTDGGRRLIVAVMSPTQPFTVHGETEMMGKTYEYHAPETDPAKQVTELIDIWLDEGTVINSSYDVLLAMVRTEQGNAHKYTAYSQRPKTLGQPLYNMVGWVGDIIDAPGRAWDNIDGGWNWVVGNTQELWNTYGPHGDADYDLGRLADISSSTTIQEQRRQATIRQQQQEVTARIVSPEGLITMAATQRYDANRGAGLYAAVQSGRETIMALGPTDLAATQALVLATARGADLDARIAASVPSSDSGLKTVLGTGVRWTLEGLSALGSVSMWGITHGLDFLNDVGEAFYDTIGVSTPKNPNAVPGPSNPLVAFKNSWDWTEANRPSEYFGWDPNGPAMWLDMAAMVAADPFLIVTLGAAKSAGNAMRLLTEPALLPQLLNKPTTRALATEVFAAIRRADDAGALQVMSITRGMRLEHVMELMNATSVDDVIRTFGHAVPSGGVGGTWLMDLTGHTVTRNTALLVERLSRVGGNDSRTGDVLAKLFGGFKRQRQFSVAEGQFSSDFVDAVIYFFRNDRERAGFWVGRMLNTVREGYSANRTGLLLSRDQIEVLGREIRALGRKGMPAEFRATLRAAGYKGNSVEDLINFLKGREVATSRLAALDDEIALMGREVAEGRMAADAAAPELAARQAEKTAIGSARYRELSDISAEARQIRGTYAFSEGKGKPLIPDEQRARLAAINARRSELLKDPMLRGASLTDDMVERMIARHQEYIDKLRMLNKRREVARAHATQALRGTVQDSYGRLYAELLEDYGENVLKLDRIKGKIDPYTGREALDWRPITGGKRQYYEEDLDRLWPLIADTSKEGGVDEVLRKGLYNAGFFNRQSYFYLPTSPQRLVAYEMRRGDKLWEHILASNVLGAESGVGRTIQAVAIGTQRLFSTILMVPRIAFRSGTDEIIRWYATTGRYRGGYRMGSVADVLEDASKMPRQPGPLVGSVSQFGGRREFTDRTRMALRQSFEQAPMVGMTDPSAWRLVGTRMEAGVVKDRRLHRESVMRWVNSPAYLDDPGIRAYAETVVATARAQGKSVWQVMRESDYGSWDMTPFARWWQEGGRMRHRTESYSAQGMNLGGMRDAVRSANNGTVLLAERGSNAEEIANLLIGKATTVNGRITTSRADQAVVRMFGPMPSDAIGATGTGAASIAGLPGRIQDKAFDIMYGVPGYNRFGLIHEDFYDQALRTLVKGSEGRILTPQTLLDLRLVDNIEDARIFMNLNVERVQQIAREHNLVTTQMIESSADHYARNQALHLMYQPGATSMLGGMFQRYLMPFGPAQYDFMSWWAYQATRAAEVTMFGKAAQIPNVFKGFGAVRAGTAGALPLNLRLLARAGEFTKMQDMSMEAIKANGGGPAEGASVLDRIASLVPTQIIEELTFLPRIDNVDNFLIDFGPSVGPTPAWIIRLAPDPSTITDKSSLWARVGAGFRSYAETIMPAISWGEESGLNWMSVLKAVFPDYEGGARDLLTTTLRTVGKVLTGSGNKILGDSYMLRDSRDAVLAQRFGEREGFLPLDYESDEYVQWIKSAEEEAESKAWDQDWQNSLTRSLPFGRLLWAPDDMATPMWEGFVGDLDFVVQMGMMGEDIAGNIKALWQQHLDGTLTDSGSRDLHDSLITALFGLANVPGGDLMQAWLVASNPELVVPMTGRYEVAVDENGLYRGPADSRTSDGRPLLPPGIEGFDKLRVGLEAGWYVEKDTKQRIDEMNWRLAQAQRTILRYTYEQFTGKTWPPSNATNAMLRHTYTIGPQLRQSLILGGVPADMLKDQMLGTELFAQGGAISTTAQALALIPYSRDTETAITRAMLMDQWGNRALADLDEMNKVMEDRGFQHPSDWPEDALAAVRDTFGGRGGAIERGLISADEYAREYQRTYGPLEGFTFDPPPAMADLPEDAVVMRAQPDDLFIIDGDTVDLLLGDGSTRRFRLIGVNAPDHPMPGSAEAFDDLFDLLKAEGYTDVALVVWDAARFGVTAGTDYSTGQPRYKAWLYVNGQPVYNPAVFTYRNPLGISTGTTFTPLPRPGTVRETS